MVDLRLPVKQNLHLIAKAKGVKVILYMTDDPQWHNEGGHEWLDSAAYSKYKGKTVDLPSGTKITMSSNATSAADARTAGTTSSPCVVEIRKTFSWPLR
mgnify:CR=1 FL=1